MGISSGNECYKKLLNMFFFSYGSIGMIINGIMEESWDGLRV